MGNFAGATPSSFVYIYTKITGAAGGDEQWGVRNSPPAQNQPASISGHAFVDGNGNHMFDAGEGLSGYTITLSGMDEFGTNLYPAGDPTTTTDGTGAFSFTGLVPGMIYQISITDGSYVSQTAVVGHGDGNLDGDPAGSSTILNITLSSGENGIEYGFEMVQSNG